MYSNFNLIDYIKTLSHHNFTTQDGKDFLLNYMYKDESEITDKDIVDATTALRSLYNAMKTKMHENLDYYVKQLLDLHDPTKEHYRIDPTTGKFESARANEAVDAIFNSATNYSLNYSKAHIQELLYKMIDKETDPFWMPSRSRTPMSPLSKSVSKSVSKSMSKSMSKLMSRPIVRDQNTFNVHSASPASQIHGREIVYDKPSDDKNFQIFLNVGGNNHDTYLFQGNSLRDSYFRTQNEFLKSLSARRIEILKSFTYQGDGVINSLNLKKEDSIVCHHLRKLKDEFPFIKSILGVTDEQYAIFRGSKNNVPPSSDE